MFGLSRRKAAPSRRGGGFLSRLFRDSRGNTLAIVGAALVPLAAMIGSGVDMSRAYMAKTRLQTACDAAALAGRRMMTNDTITTDVQREAERFFNFNFPKTTRTLAGGGTETVGPYDTAVIAAPTVTRPEAGKVRVSASTTVPTTVMRMFGFNNLPLSVTCDAALNFVNTDVMLVLDTTTSMLCRPEDTRSPNCTTYDRDDTTTRIVALEDAVMALYDQLAPIQTQLEANHLRLRYGIVPYSSTINVGTLLNSTNASWLVDSHTYQSRVANYNTAVQSLTPVDTPITTAEAGLAVPPGVQRFRQSNTDRQISNANCANFGNNNGFTQSGTSPVGGTFTSTGPNNDADVYDPDGSAGLQANAPTAPTGYVRYQFSRNTASWSGNPANRVCDRNVTITRRSYPTRYKFTNWSYRAVTYNTSQYKTGASVTVAGNITTSQSGSVATAGTYTLEQLPTLVSNVATSPSSGTLPTTAVTWNGCIEERGTTDAITPTYGYTIPTAAYDLNIGLIPDADEPATQWRPMFTQIAYERDGTSLASASCPSAAKRLQAWTRQQMRTYVDDLDTSMYTYHDTGMIWGARLLSRDGIFASDNPVTFNNMPTSRHIIFMTDGVMQPACDNYAAWGVESLDSRVTASSCGDPEQANRHIQRMKMVCNAAKTMGVSIWVIAFGAALAPHLLECASNPNQASTAANRTELINRFRQIGANIGALRLSQ